MMWISLTKKRGCILVEAVMGTIEFNNLTNRKETWALTNRLICIKKS